MKFVFSLLVIAGLASTAMAGESALQTLTKSPIAQVDNGSKQIDLASALAWALEHADGETVSINQDCKPTLANEMTQIEKCVVEIAKVQAGKLDGQCGQFGKGASYFRFIRVNTTGQYRILGDVELENTRR